VFIAQNFRAQKIKERKGGDNLVEDMLLSSRLGRNKMYKERKV
jgi:hypothetical protein